MTLAEFIESAKRLLRCSIDDPAVEQFDVMLQLYERAPVPRTSPAGMKFGLILGAWWGITFAARFVADRSYSAISSDLENRS